MIVCVWMLVHDRPLRDSLIEEEATRSGMCNIREKYPSKRNKLEAKLRALLLKEGGQ